MKSNQTLNSMAIFEIGELDWLFIRKLYEIFNIEFFNIEKKKQIFNIELLKKHFIAQTST